MPNAVGFVVIVNGIEHRVYGAISWNFGDLTPGPYTVTVRAFDEDGVYSAQSAPFILVVSEPELPTLTIVFVDDDGEILQTRIVGVDENPHVAPTMPNRTIGQNEYRFIRWDMIQTVAQNGDVVQTFNAIWEQIEEPTHIPTLRIIFVDNDGTELQNRVVGIDANADVAPAMPNRTIGQNEYRFVRWTMTQSVAGNGNITQTFTAEWEQLDNETITDPVVNLIFMSMGEIISTINDVYDMNNITKPTPTRNGHTFTGWVMTNITTEHGDMVITFVAGWESNLLDNEPSFLEENWLYIAIGTTIIFGLMATVLVVVTVSRRRV